MNRRWLSRVLALGVGLLVPFVPAAVTSAQTVPPPPAEAYPPAAIVNLLDPFGCDASSISGNIGAVLPGSTVTLQLLRAGSEVVLTSVPATAGADGHAIYTIAGPTEQLRCRGHPSDRHQHPQPTVQDRNVRHHRGLPDGVARNRQLGDR